MTIHLNYLIINKPYFYDFVSSTKFVRVKLQRFTFIIKISKFRFTQNRYDFF